MKKSEIEFAVNNETEGKIKKALEYLGSKYILAKDSTFKYSSSENGSVILNEWKKTRK